MCNVTSSLFLRDICPVNTLPFSAGSDVVAPADAASVLADQIPRDDAADVPHTPGGYEGGHPPEAPVLRLPRGGPAADESDGRLLPLPPHPATGHGKWKLYDSLAGVSTMDKFAPESF